MMFFGKLSRRRVVVPEREDSLDNPSFLPLPAIITIISSASSECANKPPPPGGVRPTSRLFNFKAPRLLQTQVSTHFRKKSRPSPCHKINNQLQTRDIHNITIPPGKHCSQILYQGYVADLRTLNSNKGSILQY
jgi:hypothetical protein